MGSRANDLWAANPPLKWRAIIVAPDGLDSRKLVDGYFQSEIFGEKDIRAARAAGKKELAKASSI